MTDYRTALYFLVVPLVLIALAGCAPKSDVTVDVQAVLADPKQYVGSEVCKTCHLEHYDAWKTTLHSRMLQSVDLNQDAIIVDLDEQRIREDLAKRGDKLKVAADQILIFELPPVISSSTVPSCKRGSNVGTSLARLSSF